MTGWPWPLDGVQAWFEGLWNTIWEAVAWAAAEVWNLLPQWIKDALNFIKDLATKAWDALWQFVEDPVGSIQSGLEWLQQQIGNTLADIQLAIGETAGLVWQALPQQLKDFFNAFQLFTVELVKGLIAFIQDPIGTLQRGWDSVVNGVSQFIADLQVAVAGVARQVWNALPDWIQGGLLFLANVAVGLVAGAVNFFQDPIGTLQAGWNWLGEQVGNAVGAIKSGVEAFVGDVLRGAMEALGSALSGFVDWLMKQLTWLGQMIIGAVNAVVTVVGDAVNSLFTGFIDLITKAMSPGSPEPEFERASKVMTQTLWDRQLEIIQEAYKSEPSPEDIQRTATAVVGTLLTVSGLAMAGGAAADLVHPIKQIFAHRTVREILWMVGVPAVMASIITLPSAVGLLTPLRYALNQTFQPIIPTAADLVRFELREVFRPEFRAEQLQPPPSGDFLSAMAKLGYNRFWAESYWAAHWVLPSITQLNEMLHRKVIDRDTWATFVRRNDFLPVMIDKLEQIIYSPYTRVDIRRMYDVRVLNEGEMIGAYMDIGYDYERASNLATFTKLYIALPDLRARYRNGWITSDEVLSELVALGLPEARAQELFETIVKKEKTERVAKERDLTKSDILALLRYNEITDLEAVNLLKAIGYDDTEAAYLVAIVLDKLELEVKELTASHILKGYRYEIFSRDEAKAKLVEVGWSSNAAGILLRLEDARLEEARIDRMRERDLTSTQIIRAIAAGIVDGETGVNYLRYLGYSDWEINVLLQLAGLS